ncbi:SRPBCC domain-containing protein [Blastococcus goldschmidtiae]|uniref:Activator of Hsp90 ATPase homologue 1/2-like C-terminal domain-containing protein n=1 Tax=Blastococcus goldschmidtiae TaxID=3075546 RepID=A0ABU2KB72_9ACTN|nr:hypothetical protein [Blastococcus sp. DSM 46792]MDT0277418.1 hypothetical protein [Blastococcus sp. DSM 46792]
MNEGTDRIERSIRIDARADRVWHLVSQPGWWINDGRVTQHRIEVDGDVAIVHDPVHGAFPVRTVRLDPPRYAAFRWRAADGAHRSIDEESTLIEFWVEDSPQGGVLLRVVESGLQGLRTSEEQQRRDRADHLAGWEQELAAARAFLEGA